MAEELSIGRNIWDRVRDYISDIRVEMRRVTWPGKQEIYGTTVMVILTTFLFGVYFYICDQGFSHLVSVALKFLLRRS